MKEWQLLLHFNVLESLKMRKLLLYWMGFLVFNALIFMLLNCLCYK